VRVFAHRYCLLEDWQRFQSRELGSSPGGPAYLDEVAQNLANLRRISDDRDELHLGSTTGADQGAPAVPFAASCRLRDRPRRPSQSALPTLSDKHAEVLSASGLG